jgi:hypothetical protein
LLEELGSVGERLGDVVGVKLRVIFSKKGENHGLFSAKRGEAEYIEAKRVEKEGTTAGLTEAKRI